MGRTYINYKISSCTPHQRQFVIFRQDNILINFFTSLSKKDKKKTCI